MRLPLRFFLYGVALRYPISMPPSVQLGIANTHMCADWQNYTGGVFGVTADVRLDLRTRVAHISMRGIPLGPPISGIGSLVAAAEEESGSVHLDGEFAAALRRRRISIISASMERVAHTLTVLVHVPVLGAQRIVLRPVHGPNLPSAARCATER